MVDEKDSIVGHSNKHNCHRFVPEQPKGLLHRAFSVFLFNDEGKLLLQQRAKSKVTFPSVWTNTCCSHPLYGQHPDEVDLPAAVADGTTPGVKAAAVRKLAHELGIAPEQVPLQGFRFLTRLHYCAADTHTWGPQAEWGEHEVDYILFIRVRDRMPAYPNMHARCTHMHTACVHGRDWAMHTSGMVLSNELIAGLLLFVWFMHLQITVHQLHQCHIAAGKGGLDTQP